jgi:hypothetical protein
MLDLEMLDLEMLDLEVLDLGPRLLRPGAQSSVEMLRAA